MTTHTLRTSLDRRRRAIPVLWLALTAAWALVIFLTDQGGGPLAIWIAITLGPLTALQRRQTRIEKTRY